MSLFGLKDSSFFDSTAYPRSSCRNYLFKARQLQGHPVTCNSLYASPV